MFIKVVAVNTLTYSEAKQFYLEIYPFIMWCDFSGSWCFYDFFYIIKCWNDLILCFQSRTNKRALLLFSVCLPKTWKNSRGENVSVIKCIKLLVWYFLLGIILSLYNIITVLLKFTTIHSHICINHRLIDFQISNN